MRNGSALLEKLLDSFYGRHKVPIHSFTAREIIKALNISSTESVGVIDTGYGHTFHGSLEGRPIIVGKFSHHRPTRVINDIVINSQFECPVMVHMLD